MSNVTYIGNVLTGIIKNICNNLTFFSGYNNGKRLYHGNIQINKEFSNVILYYKHIQFLAITPKQNSYIQYDEDYDTVDSFLYCPNSIKKLRITDYNVSSNEGCHYIINRDIPNLYANTFKMQLTNLPESVIITYELLHKIDEDIFNGTNFHSVYIEIDPFKNVNELTEILKTLEDLYKWM